MWALSPPRQIYAAQDDEGDDKEGDQEEVFEKRAPLASFAAVEPGFTLSTIFLFALLGQQEAIFDSAASFQNVRVIAALVAFASDIGAAKLEFVW